MFGFRVLGCGFRSLRWQPLGIGFSHSEFRRQSFKVEIISYKLGLGSRLRLAFVPL